MKNTNITVPKELMETCIWSSIRYFVGRGTIAASAQAQDLTEFFRDHPDFLSPERRAWMAKDIRAAIDESIRWTPHIYVEGQGRMDAFTVLCQGIEKHIQDHELVIHMNTYQARPVNAFDPAEWAWRINLEAETAEPFKKVESNTSNLSVATTILNLTPWIKLAGYLDPTHEATVNTNYGQTGTKLESYQGFLYPQYGRFEGDEYFHFRMAFAAADKYAENPAMDVSVLPEAIKEMKRI